MRLLSFLIAAASLFALVWCAKPRFELGHARLAEHLVERIADLGDAEAAALVTGMPLDHERGLRGLVELAASSRHSVARAAQTRLDDWLETLQRHAPGGAIDANHAGRLLLSVADQLVASADVLGTGAAAWAARLGRKLVESADLVAAEDRLAFVGQCDRVLMAGTGDGRGQRISWDAAAGGVADRQGREAAPIASVEERLLAYAMQQGPLSSDPNLTRLAAGAPADAANELDQPLNLAMAERGEGGDTVLGNEPSTSVPTAAGPSVKWRAQGAVLHGRIRPGEVTLAETIDVPPPDVAHAREEELTHAPLAEVIAALVSHDRFESAAAQAALQRRGMSPIDLDIARRLAGADADARRALLDEVATRPGANLAAWLHYFAADESADVRLRALGLLATSSDQAVVADVVAKAIRDGDPRIRALAERLRGGEAPSR
jgi:hypothetical protein